MNEPRIRPLDSVTPAEVADWLSKGATVVIPTETVYGLAVKPDRPESVERVYALKGRPSDFNLPVVIGTFTQLQELGVDVNPSARMFSEAFWPGPLTLVIGFGAGKRPHWLDGRIEVAIRMPALPILLDTAVLGGPYLLTSANAHGTGAKRLAHEAAASLHDFADYVVDGGQTASTPSTIINTRYSPARVERVGEIGVSALRPFLEKGILEPEDKWPV